MKRFHARKESGGLEASEATSCSNFHCFVFSSSSLQVHFDYYKAGADVSISASYQVIAWLWMCLP